MKKINTIAIIVSIISMFLTVSCSSFSASGIVKVVDGDKVYSCEINVSAEGDEKKVDLKKCKIGFELPKDK